jgi:hypothetical protein
MKFKDIKQRWVTLRYKMTELTVSWKADWGKYKIGKIDMPS